MIEIKSETELALIEEAGRIVNKVIDEIKKIARPGTTTLELDTRAEE
ncbi:MAG: type I methionyl aminopeptidase, partial [Candidatus Omnitrophica bacterium]|nr:type I methionyl aminopeptidase [Candidatus Omnitrophota bacterium]